MSKAAQLAKVIGSRVDAQGFLATRRNKIINGNFDIWQRATSQISTGYGSDDRWRNNHVTDASKTVTRETFALGQTDVPGNPKYYSRTVVVGGTLSSTNVIKLQKMESVATLAGETATLSFWAKADASKNIAISFLQYFGSGGTPSADVTFGVTTIALSTTWQKYTVTVDVPSIVGKVLGTDNNDCLHVRIYFEAGSDFDAVTNSLGHQSGTFDIAQVQLEEGNVATDFEDRSTNEELVLCQRYYQVINWGSYSPYVARGGGSGFAIIGNTGLFCEMIYAPTITVSGGSASGAIYKVIDGSLAASSQTVTAFFAEVGGFRWGINGATNGVLYVAYVTANCIAECDAEL